MRRQSVWRLRWIDEFQSELIEDPQNIRMARRDVTIDFTFGHHSVDRAARQLLINGAPAKLGARAFDVLLALIERRDRVVTKNELLDVVWPGLVVEENNLQVHIWTLRKLLGPQAISTIPGRGYRFTAALAVDVDAHELAAPSSNAPTPLYTDMQATLFGREHDLTALPQSVLSHRLLSIVGSSGIGKTSLAKAVAAQLQPAFADGTWLVDLAALDDGTHLAPAIARTLNVTLGAGASVDALAKALQQQHLLIVLDNCEHLLHPVATLAARLLAAAPKLHLLTTSQEPLKLPGEHLYRIGTLALPAEATLATLDKARHTGAVRLFEARAHQADAHFTLTEHNIEAVVDICTQLDGVALAIELAAARVALLGVHGVRDRLGQRLSLLSSASNEASIRHRTLRAALLWSHALLSVEQKIVFGRLGVMAGTFSLEAAQQVAASETMDEWAVLDHLGALVEKSLVTAASDSRGQMSYRMLETMRHFALERLKESGEEAATREQHLAFFLELAERAEAPLAGPHQGAWLDRLSIDCDNLIAALSWCEHARDGVERALRMTVALERFWLSRGMMVQGHVACVAALALPGADRHAKLCAKAWLLSGHMQSYRGLDAQAITHYEKSVALARAEGFTELLARALSRMGYAYLSLHDLVTARGCLEEAYALSHQSSNELGHVNIAANSLAELERLEGNIDAARALYEAELRVVRTSGDRLSTMIGLNNLSMIAVVQRDHPRARDMLLESLTISDDLDSRRGRLVVMEVCAGLAASLEQWPLTPRFDGAAELHTVQMGRRRDLPDVVFLAQLIERAQQATGIDAYRAAHAAGQTLSYDEAVAEMRQWLQSAAGLVQPSDATQR